ncbi:MAG TPA: hypothetical protein VGQ49_23680 [Bryobacteraceae bacterium]|nr:hypothetical protein [Bryobacteraceae bacterium]
MILKQDRILGGKMAKTRKFNLMLGLGALCFVSAVANAQVTVTSVKVTESPAIPGGITATYCDTSTACPGGIQLWNLGGGITLQGGQTLVLTQTGTVLGSTYGNFDTSDRVVSPPNLQLCTPSTPCITTVFINGSQVYTSGPGAGGDVLNFFNTDNPAAPTISEAHGWVQVENLSNYTLSLGYADNEHAACSVSAPCFPSPFTGATHFLGGGINGPIESCPSGTLNCYDGGALLITGKQTTTFSGCTVTQGGWGAAPHGNNPGAFLAAHFPAAGVTIGGSPFFLHFSSAVSVQNFLPQGGIPGALTASATNPTSGTSAGVFAGQVLALQLNVQLEGFGSLVLTGTGTSFDGKTVADVLAAANLALAGGALPSGFTYSSLNDLVDALNNSFDGCVAGSWATAHLH